MCATPARARRSRTAASTSTSRASATSAPGSDGPPVPVGSSARATGGVAADEGLDGGEVDALHDGPPAGAGDRPRAVEGREHVAAAGEIVGERGDGPQVCDRGAVAQLVRRVVELGGVDGDGGHGPRPQLGFAARSRGAGRADELGGGRRATGVRRQQQRDLGGRAGVQRGQGVGGRGEGMRPGGAQGPAAPGGRPLAVLGPEQHAPPRRPQGVHHQHPATLRPPRRWPDATAARSVGRARGRPGFRASRYELARECDIWGRRGRRRTSARRVPPAVRASASARRVPVSPPTRVLARRLRAATTGRGGAQLLGDEVEVVAGVAGDVGADERAVGADGQAAVAGRVEGCADQRRSEPPALERRRRSRCG